MVDARKELREIELDYFNKWKETGHKKYFQKLYRGYQNLIYKASSKAAMGSNIPQSVFYLQGAQQFHDSLNTFDPNKGAGLFTHVYGGVNNKLKRINAQYGNLARIPERSGSNVGIFHINELNNTTELLRQKYNREPTGAEIAREMHVTVDQVEGLQKEVRKDLSLNAELEDAASFDEFSAEIAEMDMYYYDMSPEEKLVYEYVAGKGGKKPILKPSGDADFKAISKKLGMPESKVQKIRRRLIDRMR